MRKEGFIPQYILSVALLLAVFCVIVFMKTVDTGIKQLNIDSNRLYALEHRYPYDELAASVAKAADTASNSGLHPLTKQEAMYEMLRFADLLRENYGAAFTKAPEDYNGTISATMALSYTPANAGDFAQMLDTVAAKQQPVAYVKDLVIESVNISSGAYRVKAIVELVNPYLKGGADE